MKQDPSFKLVVIIVLAGVVTAFVTPDSDKRPTPEAHGTAHALAE